MTLPRWSPSPAVARWLIGAALLPFLLIVVARWSEPPAGTDGDYAHYLLHAKALAESRPYSDIGYIYTEMNLVGPRAQPPGWPLVLAPFVAIFGTSSAVFKVLVTVLVAAFGLTAATYFLRRNQPVAAFAAAAATPVALEAQYATGSALSDPLFCLLVWLTLLVADTDGPLGWRRGVLLAALSVAVLSVRVAGVALLPALLLFALLRQREGRLRLILPFGALLVGVGLLALVAFDRIPFVDRLATGLQNFSPVLFLRTYLVALATGALYPFNINIADDLYHLVAAVPMVIGLVLFARRHSRSALACFIIAYVCVLLAAPVREPRYAWPLLPLVMVWISSGLLWLGDRYAPARLKGAVPQMVVAFVAVVSVSSAIHIALRPARWSLIGDPDTVALFDWMRATRDTTDMRVVFTNPRVLTLETNVPAMGIPFGNSDAVVAEFDRQRITHVVVPREHIERSAERNLRRYVEERASQFPKVFANGTHDVRRFVAQPAPPAADSGALVVTRPQ